MLTVKIKAPTEGWNNEVPLKEFWGDVVQPEAPTEAPARARTKTSNTASDGPSICSPAPFCKPAKKVVRNHPCLKPLTCTEEMQYSEPIDQPKPLKDTPCKLILSEKDLNLAVSHLKIAKQIGVSLVLDQFSYQGRVCYISLSTDDTDYIVDVIALSSGVKLLAPVFLDMGIVKVMYGSEEGSLYWLQQELELFVANLFELQQGMLRLEKQTNRTLREILTDDYGVQFGTFEKYDFRLRVLTPSAIDYIRAHSHFLIYLYKIFRNDIVRSHGQKAYLKIANKINSLCFMEHSHPNVINDRYAIDEIRKTQAGQRKMMEQLLAWRLGVASKHNIDVEKVMHDACLHALVNIMPGKEFIMTMADNTKYVKKDIVELGFIVTSNRYHSDGYKKLQTMMANLFPHKERVKIWRQMHVGRLAPFNFVTALTSGRKLKKLSGTIQDGSATYRPDSPTRSPDPGAGGEVWMNTSVATGLSGDQYSSSRNVRNNDGGNASQRGFRPEDKREPVDSRSSRRDDDDGRDGDRRHRYDSPPSKRPSQYDSRMDPLRFSSSSRVESQYAQSRRERSPYMYKEQSPPRGSREESHQHDTAPINSASQYSTRHAMQFNQPKEDLTFEPPNRGRSPPFGAGRGGPSMSFERTPRDDIPPYAGPSTVDERIGKGVSYPGGIRRDSSPVSRQTFTVKTSQIYSREDFPSQTYPTIRREGPPSTYPIRSKQDSTPQSYSISAIRNRSPTYANRSREDSPPPTYPIRPRENPSSMYPIRSREDSPPQTYPNRSREDLSPTHPMGPREGPLSTYPTRSREDSLPQTYPIRPRRGPSPTYPIRSRDDSPPQNFPTRPREDSSSTYPIRSREDFSPQTYPIRPREDPSPTYPIRPREGPSPAYPREDSPQQAYPIRPRRSPVSTYPIRPRDDPSPTYPIRSREDSSPQAYPIRPREDPSLTYPIRPRRSPSLTYPIKPREGVSPTFPVRSREDYLPQTYLIRPREDPSPTYPIRPRESPLSAYPTRSREDSAPQPQGIVVHLGSNLDRRNLVPKKKSGAQRRKIGIAKALARGEKVLPRHWSKSKKFAQEKNTAEAGGRPKGSGPSPTYPIRPREGPSPAYPTRYREDSPPQTYPIRPREDHSSMYPIRSREDSPPQRYPEIHREDSSPTYPIRSRGDSPPQDYHINRREGPLQVHSRRPRDDSPPAHSQTYIIRSREDATPQTYPIRPRENSHGEIPSRSTSHYSKKPRTNFSPDPASPQPKRSRGSPPPDRALSSTYLPQTSRYSPPSRISSNSRDRLGNLSSNGKGLTTAELLYSKRGATSHSIHPNGSGGRAQKLSNSTNRERGAPYSHGDGSRGRGRRDEPSVSYSGSFRNNPSSPFDLYDQEINKINEELAMLEKKLNAKSGRFGGHS